MIVRQTPHTQYFLHSVRLWCDSHWPVDGADGRGEVCLQFSDKALRQTLDTGLVCCLWDRHKQTERSGEVHVVTSRLVHAVTGTYCVCRIMDNACHILLHRDIIKISEHWERDKLLRRFFSDQSIKTTVPSRCDSLSTAVGWSHLGVQAWYENRRNAEHPVVESYFFSRVVPHWPH